MPVHRPNWPDSFDWYARYRPSGEISTKPPWKRLSVYQRTLNQFDRAELIADEHFT
jgi:hypothetical protein